MMASFNVISGMIEPNFGDVTMWPAYHIVTTYSEPHATYTIHVRYVK